MAVDLIEALPDDDAVVYSADVGKDQKGEIRVLEDKIDRLAADIDRLSNFTHGLAEKIESLGQKTAEINGRLNAPRSTEQTALYVIGGLLTMVLVGAFGGLYHDVINQGRQLAALNERVNALPLRAAASNPTDPKSVQAIKNILRNSEKAGPRIPKGAVREVAATYIDAAQSNPIAWDAAEACFDYYSFLNAAEVKLPKDVRNYPAKQLQGFSMNIKPPSGSPNQPWQLVFQVFAGGKDVGADRAAILASVKNPQAYPGTAEWLIVESKANWEIVLDGEFMRNVIVRNTVVNYDGGPLVLENVYFVNCKFKIKMCPPGIRLGRRLLASMAVDFKEGETGSAVLHPPFFGQLARGSE